MKNHSTILIILFCLLCFSCKNKKTEIKEEKTSPELNKIELISVKDGKLFKGEKPYYFVGTNYWYGPLIAAKNNGDRERLVKELDLMKSLGIDNLRILTGAEGHGDYRVNPSLQPEQGKYNEDLLDGLDFLLSEMRKRNMYAVLYMNNNWLWSGGMAQYLEWNGYGKIPNPRLDENVTWQDYMAYTMQFHSCEPCKQAYFNHVRFLMGRTNTYTSLKYTEDNTIMSWQVANEPRVMVSTDFETAYAEWLNMTVDLIESLDTAHLISTGSEGKASSLQDINMFERMHTNKNIDYLTIHAWPKIWEWYSIEDEDGTLQNAIDSTYKYMDEHIQVAKKLNKPIVMSEFGLPREKESLSLHASIVNRNSYYQAVFKKIIESQSEQGYLNGLNFWGFAGYAKPNPKSINGKWEIGDDFSADPPQEPQGWNSVFATDTTTLELIRETNKALAD